MNSKKRCCRCCSDNTENKRKKSHLESRSIDKENIVLQKIACGCGCSRKPSAVEVKSNVRVVLREIEYKSNNIKCCSTASNCCCGGAATKTSTNTENLNVNRKSVHVAVSTIKKNPTISSNIGASEARKCAWAPKPLSPIKRPPIRKSLAFIYEQQKTIKIYEDKVEKTTKTNNLDYASASSNSDLIFQTPLQGIEKWLTPKTNKLELPEIEKNTKRNKSSSSNNNLSIIEPIQIIIDGIPSPRMKTLKKERNISSGYKGVVNLDPYSNKVSCYISYSTYIIDIIKNIMKKEEKLKIDHSLMKRSNIHPIYRTAVINWLIKLQQFLNSDSSVFYISIRLFDKLLTRIEIPDEFLQLIGMITYWIANKFCDCVEYLTVNNLQEISLYRYSVSDIMNYERTILRLLKYNISVEDPIIFVRYYIYLLQIEESNDMSFCANYLLDCFATSPEINTITLSLQACSAVYLSLQFLGSTLEIWQKLQKYPGYYKHEDLYECNGKIIERMLLIQNENYEFREVYFKYANDKYNHISVRVCESLKNVKL